MSSTIYKKGDEVLARWPGSQLYFNAIILSITKDKANVIFNEGSEEKIPLKSLKRHGDFKALNKSKSKSPGRSRSRSRAQSKSPTRASSRSSRSRTRQSIRTRSSSRSKLTATRSPSTSSLQTRSKTMAIEAEEKVAEYPKQRSVSNKTDESTPIRSSPRIASLQQTKENSMTEEKLICSKNSVKDSNSDVDHLVTKQPYGFFNHILVHITLVWMPALTYLLYFVCTKKHCSLTKLPVKFPKSFSVYFSLETFEVYMAWIAFQFVLNLLPIGKVMTSRHGEKVMLYRFNSMYILTLNLIGLAVLHYMNISTVYIYKKYFKLMTSSVIFSFLLSLFLYIKSFWATKVHVNEAGNTGCWPTDFVVGRETYPRFGKMFDFKLFAYRSAAIAWITVLIAFITHELTIHGYKVNPSLLVSCACQIVHMMGVLYNEELCLTMHSMKEALGFGYTFVSFTMFPFLYCLPTLYMMNYRPVVPLWLLIFAALLFVSGAIIMIGSNLQKHRFRYNPYDPTVAHLETMPTNKGKKLLVSGWWGWICHPNYLGEILVNISLVLPAGFKHGFPFLLPAISSIMLICFAYKDDKICKEKYGSTWDKYRERVKYRLVPYIF